MSERDTRGTGSDQASPRVGVVVAVRDGESYLAAALDSLLAQTFTRWQCLVVDDASVDGTAEVARAYTRDPRVRLLAHTGAGAGAARNVGLGHLAPSVELLAFLDGDDAWLPDALERLVAALDADPTAVGVYGTAEYMDPDGVPVHPGVHPARQRDRRRVSGLDLASVPHEEPRTTFAALAVAGPIWPAAVVLLRRAVLGVVGDFDTQLRQCEDWDLYVRCSRHGDFLFLDEQVAWYRRHGANTTGDLAASEHYQDVVRLKTRLAAENTPSQRWVAERAWRALQHRYLVRAGARLLTSLRARDGQTGPAAASLLRHGRLLLRVHRASSPDRRRSETTSSPVTPGR